MQRPPPTADQPPKKSSGSYDAGAAIQHGVSERGSVIPQQPPTLPPVTTLTGLIPGGLQTSGSTETGSPVAVRTFGVHSMLNPTAEVEPLRPPARVSQSPNRSTSNNFGSYQTPLISPRIRKRKDDASPGQASHAAPEIRPGRHMLTPKSPALRSMSQSSRRSPSLGNLPNLPPGLTEGRVYKAEPGETPSGTIPPLPPLSMGLQGAVHSVPVHEYITNNAPASYSNSTASYSGNAGGYVGSPGSSSNMAEREAPSPFRPSMSEPGPSPATAVQARSATRTYGAGQPSYQMELSTDSGTMIVPVEVDTLQASKLADEKRRRNAGASARFRQRRKEKEQAASQHIADLQKQLREITEDREFYLTERNFLRDILSRTPGVTIPPRPPSPRVRRVQVAGHYTSGPTEPTSNVEYGRHDIEPSPAQRRRTSEYQPTFATVPITSTGYPPQYPQPQGPSYSLPPPSMTPAMQDQRAQPVVQGPPAPHPHSNHPPPPPLPPASNLRPQSYDPFRRDTNPR